MVGSDETSARVGGKTWWQWVLLSSTAIYHVIADTRAAAVVTEFLAGAQPEVWVADRYARPTRSRRGPANVPGASVARCEIRDRGRLHRVRAGFQLLLLRAIAIGQRRARPEGQHACASTSADLERGSTGC